MAATRWPRICQGEDTKRQGTSATMDPVIQRRWQPDIVRTGVQASQSQVEASMSNDAQTVVGVIDYTTGNSRSVVRALDFLDVPNRMLKTPDELEGIERIILPGVGSAGTTMDYLNSVGWPETLRSRVAEGDMPFLGICVGLQVLFESSAEQDARCLGWLPGSVRPFTAGQVRVPQMGWNQVHALSVHPFVASLPADGYFYFVNSYYAEPEDAADVAAVTEYGVDFASIVARKNIMATQFHIEKSGSLGLSLLKHFVKLPQEELCSPRVLLRVLISWPVGLLRPGGFRTIST